MAEIEATAAAVIESLQRLTGAFDVARDAHTRAVKESNKSGSMFDQSLRHLTGHVKTMHGSVEEFTSSMHRWSKMFIGGEALFEVFRGAERLGKTYSKLSDIGETFGGSILELGKQAGESGLGLDQFAEALTRNSAATAEMRSQTDSGRQSMGQLQKEVRGNLKQFGFYGMSLTQLVNSTSDYAETLRETGALGKLQAGQTASAVNQLVKDATTWAGVFGKSREEIIKITNAAMREVTAASKLAELGGDAAPKFQHFITFLAGMPGQAGEMLTQMASQGFGLGGTWASDLGKAFIDVGLGDVTTLMDKHLDNLNKTGGETDQEMIDFTKQLHERLVASERSLRALAIPGSGVEAQAKQALAMLAQMRSYETKAGEIDADRLKKMKQRREADAQGQDQVTKGMLTFEETFHTLTGQFRVGFYENLLKGLGEVDSKEWTATINNLRTALRSLGASLGNLLSLVLQPKTLNAIVGAMQVFLGWATTGLTWFTNHWEDTVKPALISLGEWIAWFVKGLHDLMTGAGLSDNVSTVVETVLIGALVSGMLRNLVVLVVGGMLRSAAGLLLPLLATPQGLAALAIGGIAYAGYKMVQQQQREDEAAKTAGYSPMMTPGPGGDPMLTGYVNDQTNELISPEEMRKRIAQQQRAAPAVPSDPSIPTAPITSPTSLSSPLAPIDPFRQIAQVNRELAERHRAMTDPRGTGRPPPPEAIALLDRTEDVGDNTKNIRDFAELQTLLLGKIANFLDSIDGSMRKQAGAVI